MAFNIFRWIASRTSDTATRSRDFLDQDTGYTQQSLADLSAHMMHMAMWSTIRKISQSIGAITWDVYRKGKKINTTKEYWLWNYAPNPNQTAEEFFDELIARLYIDGQAIVVETGHGYRYVADGYSVDEHLSGDIYTDFTAHGEPIRGRYSIHDILRFTLSGQRITTTLSALADAEGTLMKSAVAAYKRAHGIHGVLKVSDIAEAAENFEEEYTALVQKKFKTYFESDNAVLPLFDGYDFDESDKTAAASKSDLVGTRDIRAMMDDIVEITAEAFGVPVSIVTGKDLTADDYATFLSGTVMPIARMIATEINRKLYNQQNMVSGSYIAPDYSEIQYRDVFDLANPIDKLIGSGAFSVNDVRARLSLPRISEEWADQHWMTKNYSPADELLNSTDNSLENNQPGEEEQQDE